MSIHARATLTLPEWVVFFCVAGFDYETLQRIFASIIF